MSVWAVHVSENEKGTLPVEHRNVTTNVTNTAWKNEGLRCVRGKRIELEEG